MGRREVRVIPGGDGQDGREAVLRGCQEAKAWGAGQGRGGKARTAGEGGRQALTAYSRMRFSLSSLGYSMLLLWGGQGSEVSPGANAHCLSTPAARASPFLAETNTHEAGLVGPVRFHSDGAAGPREGSCRAAAPKRGGATRDSPVSPAPSLPSGSHFRLRSLASQFTELGRGQRRPQGAERKRKKPSLSSRLKATAHAPSAHLQGRGKSSHSSPPRPPPAPPRLLPVQLLEEAGTEGPPGLAGRVWCGACIGQL